jgi:hypothetical protein
MNRLIKKYFWVTLTILGISYFIFLHLYNVAPLPKIEGDLASWVLSADSLLHGRGAPYRDYWDTKPPGLILFLSLWILVFGESMRAFILLHILLVSITTLGILRLYYKIFPKVIFAAVSLLTVIIFLSPRITFFLPIELFGLSFCLIGINILITEKWTIYKRGFWGTFFILLGGQMKESFAPIALSIIPFLGYVVIVHKNEFKKTILRVISAVICLISLLFIFLILTNSLKAYIEVFRYLVSISKRSKIAWALEFPQSTFTYLQFPLIKFLYLFITLYFFIKFKLGELGVSQKIKKGFDAIFITSKFNEKNLSIFVAIFYSVGSWIGFILQNRFGSHYDSQMVFPVMIFQALPIYILYDAIKRFKIVGRFKLFKNSIFVLAVLLITVMIFPKKAYFVEYPYKEFNIIKLFANQKLNLSLEERIKKKINPSECILHIYGWGVGATYLYSERKPCTRFFLVNLTPETHFNEYKTTLIKNPPEAIIYTQGGADMESTIFGSIEAFENNIFHFRKVLDKCYRKDEKEENLYLPKLNGEALQVCLEKNS